jgi:HEPN domain-containing protein
MLDRKDIKNLAKARHEDARVLLLGKRYESAMYLCGYAIELSLKARICRTLKWVGYPATAREFGDYKSFKTHNLNVLLRLSGIDDKVKKLFSRSGLPSHNGLPSPGTGPLEWRRRQRRRS